MIDDATEKFEEALSLLDLMEGFEQIIPKLRSEWNYHMQKDEESDGLTPRLRARMEARSGMETRPFPAE